MVVGQNLDLNGKQMVSKVLNRIVVVPTGHLVPINSKVVIEKKQTEFYRHVLLQLQTITQYCNFFPICLVSPTLTPLFCRLP